MRNIYKYPLRWDSNQTIELPVGTKPLSVQMQGRQLCMWAEVPADPFADEKEVTIFIVGTGSRVPPGDVNYLGTVQFDNFVWHVYASTAMGERD